MRDRGLPNLAFSTRSRHPSGGADAVREVIATSPGVGEVARREFAARADLGGSLLHADLAAPVYSFSPVDEASWLFCRAVSLGTYRKGAHQFLVHGVLLAAEHLAAVDGNPLLLDRVEGGLALLDEHPGEGSELPLLTPPTLDRDTARQFNRRRFSELSERLGRDDGWFAPAWEALGRDERLALVDPRPSVELVEWLLLHLHPADRALISFHSWYSHGRPLAYRLLVTAPQEAARVRGQFRGIRLVERTADGEGAGGEGPGTLARRLRRRDPDAYTRAVTEFHLSRLARRPLPPLDDADVALCLRAALEGDDALDGERRRRLDLLRLRSEPAAALRYAVGDLAAAWRRGAADFAALLEPMAISVEVRPSAVAAVASALGRPDGQDGDDRDERWALLALLDAADRRQPGRDLAAARAPTWRRLVPPRGLDDLVGGFDPRQAEAAEGVLVRFVLVAAEAVVEGTGGEDDPGDPDSVDWPALLGWFAARDRWPEAPATAAALEHLARSGPPAVGRTWLRRLGELHARAGARDEALRLWLDGEAPLLAGEQRRDRVEAVVGWALDQAADADSAGLDRFLDHAELADAVPAAVAAWGARQADPGAAWRRLEGLIASWRMDRSAAPAVGSLAARLAASPLAERVPPLFAALLRSPGIGDPGRFLGAALAAAADRLTPQAMAARSPDELRRVVGAATELLRVRNGNPVATAADGALLRLALPALVAAQELAAHQAGAGQPAVAAAVTRFRDAWTGLLASRSARHLDGPEPAAGLDGVDEEDWLDLLLDDFDAAPPTAAEEDPRYHFFIVLAWRAWAADPSSRRRLRLRRGLQLPSIGAGPAWHRERIAAVVPSDRAGRALRLLGLPPSGTGDNLRRMERR